MSLTQLDDYLIIKLFSYLSVEHLYILYPQYPHLFDQRWNHIWASRFGQSENQDFGNISLGKILISQLELNNRKETENKPQKIYHRYMSSSKDFIDNIECSCSFCFKKSDNVNIRFNKTIPICLECLEIPNIMKFADNLINYRLRQLREKLRQAKLSGPNSSSFSKKYDGSVFMEFPVSRFHFGWGSDGKFYSGKINMVFQQYIEGEIDGVHVLDDIFQAIKKSPLEVLKLHNYLKITDNPSS